MKIPVVDLFAGPGGLNEGFSRVQNERGEAVFETAISVEMDEFAHQTLELRALVRLLKAEGRIKAFHDYARDLISRDDLFAASGAAGRRARKEALRATMGESFSRDAEIEDCIREAMPDWPKKEFALIGGPPCQAYSLVGRSRRRNEERQAFESDPRHRLYRQYLRIVEKFKPAVFLMENVTGLLSARLGGENMFSLIYADLANAGYRLYSLNDGDGDLPGIIADNPRRFVVNASHHGVPQARARVFILGVRNGFNDNRTPRALPNRDQELVSVGDVLSDLPLIRSRVSRCPDDAALWREEIIKLGDLKLPSVNDDVRRTLKTHLASLDPSLRLGSRYLPGRAQPKKLRDWYASVLPAVLNHNSRGHMAADLRRYFFWSVYGEVLESSPSLAEVPANLRPNHRNVSGDASDLPFADRFRVQLKNRPSSTITSHIAKDGHYYIHYDAEQCRSLSVREAARLQTFPDDYLFEGPITEQYRQVGNAVPSFMAKQIGDVVADIMR